MIENWIPILLPNGNMLVPTAFEHEDVLGDGMDEVTPGSEAYEQWTEWMRSRNISPRLERVTLRESEMERDTANPVRR